MQGNQRLYDEDISGIIEEVPPWLIRKGLGLLFVIILVIFFGLAVIKYPESAEFPVTIELKSPNYIYLPPKENVISALMVKENSRVVQKTPLLSVKNLATNDTFTVLSPIEGIVTIRQPSNSDQMAVIVISSDTSYVIEGNVPARLKEDIFVSQKVRIRLNKYGDKRYEYLEGSIGKIGQLQQNRNFLVMLHLKNGLKPSKSNWDPRTSKVEGKGVVFLERKTVLEMILQSFRRS